MKTASKKAEKLTALVTDDNLRRAREHIARKLTVREAATCVKVGKTALYEALTVDAAYLLRPVHRLSSPNGPW